MKKRWLPSRCICGKHYSFNTEREAYEYLASPQAPRELTYSYKCKVASSTWHVTSKKPNNSYKALSALESELRREMSTASEAIVKYMRAKYEKENQTKFTAKELKVELPKKDLRLSSSTIQNAITALKEKGVIVVLDGKVPGTAKGSYYTLEEILDKQTAPKPKPEPEAEKGETAPVSKIVSVPSQDDKPKPPVANPFDKVFSELGEIKSKVNGLVQGYSEIARKPMIQGEVMDTSAITNTLEEIKAALSPTAPVAGSTTPPFNPELFMEELTRRMAAVIGQINFNFTADVAEEVNRRLADISDPDGFVFGIREEVIRNTNDLKAYLTVKFDEQNITQTQLMRMVSGLKIPEQITNPDDYKQGIREGIRMAVELGITRIN